MTYVDTINTGAVPCLENAVTTLAQLENSAAVQKAAEHYSERMARRLRLPTDTLQELLEVHAACEREAIAIFMDSSFKDKDQEFQRGLVVICLRIYHPPPPALNKKPSSALMVPMVHPSLKDDVVCGHTRDRVSKDFIFFFFSTKSWEVYLEMSLISAVKPV